MAKMLKRAAIAAICFRLGKPAGEAIHFLRLALLIKAWNRTSMHHDRRISCRREKDV